MQNQEILQKIIYYPIPAKLTNDKFIEMHVAVEGYFRRLLLIGLQKNDIQYTTAQRVANASQIKGEEYLETIIKLISNNQKSIKDFIKSNPDLGCFINLFVKFSSKYRNCYVHGIRSGFNDDIIRHCYLIDRCLIDEFENTLEINGFPSAFEEPKVWSCKRITKQVEESNLQSREYVGLLKKLKINEVSPTPIAEVANAISKTKYKSQFQSLINNMEV